MARLGIDIGGTFTDFALIRPDGATAVHKRLTTPRDPARAVLEGVAAIVQENDLSIDDITEIVHGTTLVTNALIERSRWCQGHCGQRSAKESGMMAAS